MPFTGPNDENLPEPVKGLPENDRKQWVSIWNDSRNRCIMEGGSPGDCEGVAFRNANGVLFGEKIGMFDLSKVDGLCFVGNQVAEVERRTVGNTDFLVSPGVLVKSGVLNDELVPPEEVQAHFSAWNGQPVVIGHPRNLDGVNISANHPAVLNALQIGKLFNTTIDDGKLKSELWIDLARAQTVHRGREVVSKLESGESLEVSTAYFRDVDMTEGSHDGIAFSSIARNLRPDHLAILLDTEGACSLQDGCGTPRANEGETMTQPVANVMARARRPSFDGTETTPWEDVAKTFTAFSAGYFRHTDAERPDDPISRVQDAPQTMKDWIASKTLIGDPNADTEADLIAFPVVNPSTNQLNAGGVRGAVSRAPQADISEETTASIQSVGRDLLESQFGTETEQAQNSLRSAWDTFTRKLGFNQEVNPMDELIQAILTDGRLGFNEEQLRVLDEAVLTNLAEMLKATAAVTEPEVLEEESPVTEPAPAPETTPAAVSVPVELTPVPAANADCDKLSVLVEAMEKRGGAENVLALLDELQANKADVHGKLVTALVANEQCSLTKEQLETMDTITLQALKRSFIPADYSGQGAALQPATNREQVYDLPSMYH
jgi:hypothetical protein